MLRKLDNMFYLLIGAASIVPLVGCGPIKKEPNHKVSAYESAEFQRQGEVFNNKTNTEIRVQKLAEEEAIKAAEAKKKKEEAQDKGEGQVKMKF